MSDHPEAGIPPQLNPRQEDCRFDLALTLRSLVSLRTRIPEDAATAPLLGTERGGHGVVIDGQGLILTIGYLVAEAEQAWVFDQGSRAVPADVVAYDYETGFGLLRALGRLDAPPAVLGEAGGLAVGDPVILAAPGGSRHALSARIAATGEFAGYWEYLLERALFTTPAHPDWGGAALFDGSGRLCGIGSLYLENVSTRGTPHEGNLCVPVDLLPPILDELLRYGRTLKPPRPWLGVFVAETEEELVIGGVYPGGPAAAVLREGDVLLALAGERVGGLAAFYRRLWAHDTAGAEIPLKIRRAQRELDISVRSVARRDTWKKPLLH